MKFILAIIWGTLGLLFLSTLLPDPLFIFPPSDFGLAPMIIPNYFIQLFWSLFPWFYMYAVFVSVILLLLLLDEKKLT